MFKVLVVDDEKEICVLAKRVLGIAKVEIDEFACVGDLVVALAKCKDMQPDVVLLDLTLVGSSYPQMTVSSIPDFLEYCKVLIVITGTAMLATDDLFIDALRNGASDVLYKPDALRAGNEGRLAKSIAVALVHYERRNPGRI